MDSMHTALLDQVRLQLAQAGWTPGLWPAVATKRFATAVGDREAFAYLQDWRSESCPEDGVVLVGVYYSEGRNILASDATPLPQDGNDDRNRCIERFAQAVEQRVAGSYARRLWQHSGSISS